MTKTLNTSTLSQAGKTIPDLITWGQGDMWKLICKASSKSEDWMKSTKAMQLPHGCLVQVTTQQGDHVAEALSFVPGGVIECVVDGEEIIGRKIEVQAGQCI